MTYFLLPPSGEVSATPTIGDKSVFASMSSEQTCLQGFANDGIHKTIGVFIKNAKNRQVFVRR